jgi:hypothetical protein
MLGRVEGSGSHSERILPCRGEDGRGVWCRFRFVFCRTPHEIHIARVFGTASVGFCRFGSPDVAARQMEMVDHASATCSGVGFAGSVGADMAPRLLIRGGWVLNVDKSKWLASGLHRVQGIRFPIRSDREGISLI